jgi:hypothetical protein
MMNLVDRIEVLRFLRHPETRRNHQRQAQLFNKVTEVNRAADARKEMHHIVFEEARIPWIEQPDVHPCAGRC